MKKQTYTMLFSILIILLFPSNSYSRENRVCKVKTIKDLSECRQFDILSIDLKSGYTQAQDIIERACDFRFQVTSFKHTTIVNCSYFGLIRNVLK